MKDLAIQRFGRVTALVLWSAVVGAGAILLVKAIGLNAQTATPTAESEPDAPRPTEPETGPSPDKADWSERFQFTETAGALDLQDRSIRFRLAGTFFYQESDQAPTARSAILDDLQTTTQHWVKEGDTLDEMEVLRIYRDRVIVRDRGNELEIRLSYSDTMDAESTTPVASGEEEPAPLETTRFGKRIGENRWVMQRSALEAYYRELLDDPERIVQVYQSMTAVRGGEENEVLGFRLDPVGEQAFFTAVGLREGDEIRKVNSMNMTSQPRAEYFLSEFMKDRLGAVVLDVVREGEEQKLIYLIR